MRENTDIKMETVTNIYHISLGKIAKKLAVSNRALIDFLRKKDLFFQVPRDGRGIIIPIPLANRILGKKSNPPQYIFGCFHFFSNVSFCFFSKKEY